MTCQQYHILLSDYVDGTLAASDRARLEAHLSTCAACRAEAEDFGAIRAAARGLERHVPPPHVWRRLSVALDKERARPSLRNLARRLQAGAIWRPVAVAAALLLAVGATSWVLWRQIPSTPPARTAMAPAADPELVQTVETELKLAEEHYQKAIAGLEQITRSESAALDPQVAAVLQKNLEVIDQAIGESRAALQTQPASDVAQESLFEALRSKVSLLQDTVVLINEMRKGNPEGTARIVSGLNQ